MTGNIECASKDQEAQVHKLIVAVNSFCKQLENLDARSLDPKANPEELLALTTKAILETGGACKAFEGTCEPDHALLLQTQTMFREITQALFSKSYFMNRARTWPRGYPGDYLTLEGVYRNCAMSSGIGLLLDRYFLSTTLANAVRTRKDKLRELLKTELDNRTEPRILDIACGSCREVFELAPTIKRSGAVITCVDFDSDALSFSENRISTVGLSSGQITFRKYNALKMINKERNEKEFGCQDVIYSVGFFDYLSDEMLVRLLQALYALLNPGGCLIASFKDSDRYGTFDYHWLVNWNAFLQRTEKDMWTLFEKAGIPIPNISASRDASGVILFFKAVKQPL